MTEILVESSTNTRGNIVDKKLKKKKLEHKAKIRRRLLRLWHTKVMLLNGNACAVSGIKNGSITDGKPAILDAHHIEGKECNPSLRFDALNGIALTKSHHKFGRDSFHKAPLWAAEWLRNNRPEQYAYILSHRNDAIDLEDRDVLYAIEAKLKAEPTEEEKRIVNSKPAYALAEPESSCSEPQSQPPEPSHQSDPHQNFQDP